LYFCTSKASKLSTTPESQLIHRHHCVSICTFVLVKQVKRVP
jgi:hypothetical protein